MAAGDTHVVDLVDNVHHEINSAIRSHCVYKYVWSPAINRKTTHPREGAFQPIHTMNLQYMAVIKDFQIAGQTLSEIYSQIAWYYTSYTKGLSYPLSSVCHITGRRRKGKGVKVP